MRNKIGKLSLMMAIGLLSSTAIAATDNNDADNPFATVTVNFASAASVDACTPCLESMVQNNSSCSSSVVNALAQAKQRIFTLSSLRNNGELPQPTFYGAQIFCEATYKASGATTCASACSGLSTVKLGQVYSQCASNSLSNQTVVKNINNCSNKETPSGF